MGTQAEDDAATATEGVIMQTAQAIDFPRFNDLSERVRIRIVSQFRYSLLSYILS